MKFIPYNKATEVLQPGKKTLHLPAAAITPQGAPILCFASLFTDD
jgi:hypothetical protein